MYVLRPWCTVALIALLASPLSSPPALAFTQSGAGFGAFLSGIPIGHEWLTRRSFFEFVKPDPLFLDDQKDPRKSWTKGKAQNLNVSDPGSQAEIARITAASQKVNDGRYFSVYDAVYSAIIGERWVDIGGFNVVFAKGGTVDCFNGVAQNPDELQYDHYLRAQNDTGGAGGVTAATQANARFVTYFVNAAMAYQQRALVWDGGGVSSLVEVDLNYFMMGRAAHLLQDSFSLEHAVRVADDNYTTLRQVKSYVCTAGSEQHGHDTPSVNNYQLGDVIWKPGTELTLPANYLASNMKTNALVAMEAQKDLWAAWIRTMGTPFMNRETVAHAEATTLVKNWLYSDAAQMQNWYTTTTPDSSYVSPTATSGPGSQAACLQTSLGVASGKMSDLTAAYKYAQRACLYNVAPTTGYADLVDPQMKMPYNWKWGFSNWTPPPSGWQPPMVSTRNNLLVYIASMSTDGWMTVDTVAPLVPVRATDPSNMNKLPLVQVQTSQPNQYIFRLRNAPSYFIVPMADGDPPGELVLFKSGDGAAFIVAEGMHNTWVMTNPVTNKCATVLGSPYTGMVATSAVCEQNSPDAQWFLAYATK